MHTTINKLGLYLLLAGTALFIICGCDNKTRKDTISDKQLAVFQKELLDIAFETATAIPVNPHIKDRSRAQEAVVEICLKLNQPKRALAYIEKIDNWHRGLCYADLAFYYAEHGCTKDVQNYLHLASQISETAEDWRKDRIRLKIDQTQKKLKQSSQGIFFESEEYFDQQAKKLDALIASDNFDIVKNSLKSYTRLFNRFYTNEKQRSLVEEKIRTSWDKLPVFIRIELLMDIAEFALGHRDKSKALELVNRTQLLADGVRWRLEHRISITAKLANLRFRAGDMENAIADADAAFALFNVQKSEIVNIYRAEAIRPLAEAYQSMGNTEAALSVYKQAVEEGIENSNSRPRAEDLSATCCSMALYAVEPDAELWTQIHQISEGLGHPW